MDKKDFHKQLVERYVNDQATEEELEVIFHFIETGEIDETLKAYMDEAAEQTVVPIRPRRLWPRIAIAASLLIALSFGAYKLLHKQAIPVSIAKNKDISPGHNQATLTLASGQKIILTKGMNGKLAQNISVNSTGIIYQSDNQNTLNTLSTKRGEASPYPVQLPDGTKVWLNAQSKLTYPTAFTGNDRQVSLEGEAYFEVAHDPTKPFRVKSAQQTVEVLGTHFDVNTYTEESSIKTTLLEGKVKVTANSGKTAILAPGQQSQLTGSQPIKVVKADADITLAWKDGMFRFDSTPLSDIMNQIARWYDVNISYQDETLKNKTFFAMSTRFANASQLLHNLEQTGEVKFKIEGNTITVLKK